MLKRDSALSAPRVSIATTEAAASALPFARGLELPPPDSPAALSALGGSLTCRPMPLAEPCITDATRTFTSNIKKRPSLISPSNSQFMRQNMFGPTHRHYDKNGRPITPRELIKINSHYSLRTASSTTVTAIARESSNSSLWSQEPNKMQRLEGNENVNFQNLPDLRYHKTQQNFMKRDLSTSTFSNRRKSSSRNPYPVMGRLDRRPRYDELPTSIPDSSSDEGDLFPIEDLAQRRASIFVDDQDEIEEILEVESTITSSYCGNFEDEPLERGFTPALRY